jgi:hypothetical protein
MPRMLPRTVASTALVAVAALGVVAQPASAAKHRRMYATFEATYKTTWDQPRAGGGGNCSGHFWVRGGGTEEWTVKTRTPQKVLVYKTGYGVGIHPSWDPHGDHGDLDAFGRITRDGMTWTDTEPGWCGGETASIPEFTNPDCGTRLPEYKLAFFGTEKVYPQIQVAPHMRKEKLGFERCPLRVPAPLTAGAWPKVEKSLPVKQVLTSRKPVKITGQDAWDNADEAAAMGYTTTSTMTWTLTLNRR